MAWPVELLGVYFMMYFFLPHSFSSTRVKRCSRAVLVTILFITTQKILQKLDSRAHFCVCIVWQYVFTVFNRHIRLGNRKGTKILESQIPYIYYSNSSTCSGPLSYDDSYCCNVLQLIYSFTSKWNYSVRLSVGLICYA